MLTVLQHIRLRVVQVPTAVVFKSCVAGCLRRFRGGRQASGKSLVLFSLLPPLSFPPSPPPAHLASESSPPNQGARCRRGECPPEN